MSLFYTNVRKYGSELLVKEVHNGKRERLKVKYKPYLFVPAQEATEYHTVFGAPVSKIDFDSIKEANNFVDKYSEVSNFEFFGATDYQYVFMNDNYSGEFDPDYINVVSLDIETMSNDGFPEPELADKELTVLTLTAGDRRIVIDNGSQHLGRGGDYVPAPGVEYIPCRDEELMLMTFVEKWGELDPDVVTGYNCSRFDVVYLINRIIKLLGDKWAKRLSPWGIVREKTMTDRVTQNQYQTYDIYGVEVLDYMDLYKKWTFVKRENYKLATIAEAEGLNEGKLDYSDEYSSLHDLYTRNYQLYVEYNIRDTEVVVALEEKLKLIALVFAVAYQAKVNYTDTYSPVKTWDMIIHNLLMSRNMVVPMKSFSINSDDFIGGYVKEPIPGMYEWPVSFDLDSLYPSLIMQYNISPEKYISRAVLHSLKEKHPDKIDTIDYLLNSVNHRGLVTKPFDNHRPDENILAACRIMNFGICPNGAMFSNDGQGFLAELMETFYAERKSYKKKSIENKKEYERTHDIKFKKLSVLFDTIQLARKVLLNSAYGALANAFFRWTNKDFAEAITSSGQMVIQTTSDEVNKLFNQILKTECGDFVIANDTDSVVGDTIIEINGKSVRIADLFDSVDIGPIITPSGAEVKATTQLGYRSPSVSASFDLEEKPVKYVMRHKVKKKLYKLVVRGREVIVTEDHAIMVRRGGTLQSVKPMELNDTDEIILKT